ncbi:hypothetical protein AA313_de0200995 [Arthrobotrys entomopaga]|nr:hypothetical protein AA313_de0200995 [Arthrobotrys entomopaga]
MWIVKQHRREAFQAALTYISVCIVFSIIKLNMLRRTIARSTAARKDKEVTMEDVTAEMVVEINNSGRKGWLAYWTLGELVVLGVEILGFLVSLWMLASLIEQPVALPQKKLTTGGKKVIKPKKVKQLPPKAKANKIDWKVT